MSYNNENVTNPNTASENNTVNADDISTTNPDTGSNPPGVGSQDASTQANGLAADNAASFTLQLVPSRPEPDPFDPAQFAATETVTGAFRAVKEVIRLGVRKPNKQ